MSDLESPARNLDTSSPPNTSPKRRGAAKIITPGKETASSENQAEAAPCESSRQSAHASSAEIQSQNVTTSTTTPPTTTHPTSSFFAEPVTCERTADSTNSERSPLPINAKPLLPPGLKPYYADERSGIYIICGDCREVLPSLPGYFRLVFTSPPYNLGGEPWPHLGNWKNGDSAGGKSKWRNGSDASTGPSYASHHDNMPHAEYVAWQRDVLTMCWGLLSEDGAIFYNHKPRVIGAKLWLPLELNPELPLRQIVIWSRAGGMNFNPTAYVPTHEWVMVFAKEAFRLRDKAASGVGDVWRVAQEANPNHPAPFPLGLPRAAIETTGPGMILDPFMGSGTTLRAAKDLGRKAIGIEIEERYAEIAARRMEQSVLPFENEKPQAEQVDQRSLLEEMEGEEPAKQAEALRKMRKRIHP